MVKAQKLLSKGPGSKDAKLRPEYAAYHKPGRRPSWNEHHDNWNEPKLRVFKSAKVLSGKEIAWARKA